MSAAALPVLQKPPFGEPCNGCGECCKAGPCMLGRAVFDKNVDSGTCPALEVEDSIYRCGLLLHPSRYASRQAEIHGEGMLKAAAALLIGSDLGCDCKAEGESANHSYEDFLKGARGKISNHILQSTFVWVNKGGE